MLYLLLIDFGSFNLFNSDILIINSTTFILILETRKPMQRNLMHRTISHQLSSHIIKSKRKLDAMSFSYHAMLLGIPKYGFSSYQKSFCFTLPGYKMGTILHEHSLKEILRRCKHIPGQWPWLGQKRLGQVSPGLGMPLT